MGSYARVILTAALVGALAAGVSVFAQESPEKGIEMKAPPPPKAPGIRFESGQPREMTRVREEEHYPERVGARHEPAFLEPLTTTIQTGPESAVRAGLAGWTAPRVPHDIRESTGAVAFGLTLRWGMPVPAQGERAAEPGR